MFGCNSEGKQSLQLCNLVTMIVLPPTIIFSTGILTPPRTLFTSSLRRCFSIPSPKWSAITWIFGEMFWWIDFSVSISIKNGRDVFYWIMSYYCIVFFGILTLFTLKSGLYPQIMKNIVAKNQAYERELYFWVVRLGSGVALSTWDQAMWPRRMKNKGSKLSYLFISSEAVEEVTCEQIASISLFSPGRFHVLGTRSH